MTRTGLRQPGFRPWLGAATLSATGDGVLYFALAWTASGVGPGAATAVLVAGLVPEVLLTLFGGAAADRWGARRTLIACTAAMAALIVAFLAAGEWGVPLLSLLLVVAVSQGVVGAFHVPANGVLPRLFLADDDLARGLAVVGSVLSLARLAGPPLGAVVVAAFALHGALVVDLATFGVVLVVLLAIRPPRETSPGATDTTAWQDVMQGLRALRQVPGIGALLGSLALVAGGLLPLLVLGVPLLARDRGWVATDAGLIEASWIAGTLAVTVVVARCGTRDRALTPLYVGPALAAVGVIGLALAPVPWLGCAAAAAMGVGTSVYTTHFFPLYVLRSPAHMLARFQSVVVMVQMLVMLLGNLGLGSAIAHLGVTPALLAAATVCAAAAVPVVLSPTLRVASTR